MATFDVKGDNYTVVENAAGARTFLPACKWRGKLRVQSDKHTTTAQYDNGSTFKMARLPKGAIPLLIIVSYEAMGAAVTANIGDGSTADKFGAITSMVAAGQQVIGVKLGAIGQQLSADTDIVITTTANNISSGKTLRTAVIYVTNE